MKHQFERYRHYAPHIAAWISVALLISAVWLHAYALIDKDRATVIAEAVRTLSNLTRVAQEHAARTFRSADQTLHFVAARYKERGDSLNLQTMAQHGVIDTDIFNQVGVIDANGIYALSTLPSIEHIDLSDRAHFKVHLTEGRDELFISKAVLGRASKKWSIQLTRRIDDKNGRFGGVVVASITPDYFTHFFGELDLGVHGGISLLGLDGSIRARRAGKQDTYGIQLPESSIRSMLAIGDHGGAYTKKSATDGIERIHFYRRIQPYQMAIVAGLSIDEVLQPHREARTLLLSQATLATLLLATLGLVFSLYQQRVRREMNARKQAMEQLANSEQRMALALDGADLGMWDWHIPETRYIPDARLAGMLGYTMDEIEANWELYPSRLHRDDHPHIKTALHPHLKGQTPGFELTYRLRHKQGHWLWLMARGKVVARNRNGRAERLVGTAFDVTKRVHAEQQLSELNVQLGLRASEAEAANRAKSAFIANISHELRTPMNAVIGIGYLLEQIDLPGKSNALVRKIGVAGNTLLSIINDVLDFSKIEAGCVVIEQVEFRLDEVLTKLDAIMSGEAAKKQLTLVISAPDADIGTLIGDRLHLKQILLNLVGNAIKFTARGQVSVEISVVTDAAQQIGLRFLVRDTGIGIAPDRQEAIFDAFAQEDDSTTRRFGGSGLGLTISRRLVTLMNGEMGLVSAQGKGSQFWFTLNFARSPDTSGRAVNDDAAPVDSGIESATEIGRSCDGCDGCDMNSSSGDRQQQRLRGVRILVVDDSDINRDIAQLILAGEGASVTLAGDGKEAVDALLADPGRIDLILMDVQMPVMDGYAATRLIRAHPLLAAVPVIALTAGAFDAQADAAREAGMNGFIAKPFDVNDTVAMILRLTGRLDSGKCDAIDDAAIDSADAQIDQAATATSAQLPGIAVEAGLATWKNEKIYRQYLRKFANDYAGSARNIKDKLARAEQEQALAIAHKLAGAAASLALTQVALQARATEEALRSTGTADATALTALQAALDTALASIALYAPP